MPLKAANLAPWDRQQPHWKRRVKMTGEEVKRPSDCSMHLGIRTCTHKPYGSRRDVDAGQGRGSACGGG